MTAKQIMYGLYLMVFTAFIEISLETDQLNPTAVDILSQENLSAPKGTELNHNEATNGAEEEEYRNVKRKWENLIGSSEVNRTSLYIPQSWLLHTNKQNVTFNASLARPEVSGKLAALIKEHQTPTRSVKHNEDFRNSEKSNETQRRLINISLKDKVTDLRNKITNIGKKGSIESNKNISNEYPGKNETARNMLFEEWKIYYECLKHNTGLELQAHYVFPGETIKLTCQACLRPGDETKVKWWVSTSRTGHKEKEFDPSKRKTVFSSNNRISIKDGSLSLFIYGVNEKDAGNYSCRVSKALISLHLVQVADEKENITKVWPEEAHGKQKAALPITLANFGLTVFTKWKTWTACSRCSHVGKRFKVGVCMVKAANGDNSNALKVLSLFREGIPCRSKLLPQAIQNHPNVVSRNSEIMESFCKEPCPKAGKYVVRDEKGQVVEEADNAKGVYSMLQKLPNLHPPTRRKIIFLKQWDTAHIQCPGNNFNDIPTRWFVNDQPIFARGDRIYVTPSHTLVVEDLGVSDSNLYSCWQGSTLVGTVRLVITEPVQRLAFTQQISALSMVLIVITLAVIFVRAFSNAFLNNKLTL